MAVKDSEELKSDERYPLGDYSFRIERSSVPGSTNDKIEAICTKDGKNARKSIQIPSSTQIEGWYVEANETEATVYAVIKSNGESPVPVEIPQASSTVYTWNDGFSYSWVASPYSTMTAWLSDPSSVNIIRASGTSVSGSSSFTYNGKTVYYDRIQHHFLGVWSSSLSPNFTEYSSEYSDAEIAWSMIYGSWEEEEKEKIVGRFAIDLGDAGGDGPGSDWIDPGDYDPDWEEGDPTHTLYVTVTGALSGRHNDPIVDPSYSYIPSDKDTVKDYGCGGDGGHGGGGGAGASTVVVHKFATNQANGKEVTAIARRHGYGSGGGKGGKGGDGCILVYY